MYRKILVPLDGSIKEVDEILRRAQSLLSPEGEGILLQVVAPKEARVEGLRITSAAQLEKEQRSRAMGYLGYFAAGLNKTSGNWRCEVVVSKSVARGILDFAAQEQVDLIAMYTHGRKGLAKLIKASVSEQVRNKASQANSSQAGPPTEVLVVGPHDLAFT